MSEALAGNTGSHFRGRSEHTLDEKGRLNIASRFREVLRRQGEERLMITPWNGHIRAYSLPHWEALESALLAQERKGPEIARLIRFMIGGAEECSLDKQGRILIPVKMREACGVGKEVVINGVLTHFEIWGRERWEQENTPSREDFLSFERGLQEVGLF